MARNFILANSEVIRFGSGAGAILQAAPTNYTWLCKARSPDATPAVQELIVGIGASDIGSRFLYLLTVVTDGRIRTNITGTNGNNLVFTTGTISANTWHSVGGRKVGDDVYTVLDTEISSPGNFDVGTFSGTTTNDVGAFANNGAPTTFFNGDVAEYAIWSVNLTDEEILAYHAGMSPLQIRPESLIFYAPLYGLTNEFDLSGQSNGVGDLTDVGLVASHPPVSKFSPRQRFQPMVAKVLTPYAPPESCDVDFNLQPVVPPSEGAVLQTTELHNEYEVPGIKLREGELLNQYEVEVARLAENGEINNKYSVNPSKVHEGELNDLYTIQVFRDGIGELGNKYSIAPAILRLGELLNKYDVQVAVLKDNGELGNKYAVTPATLTFGELRNLYEVKARKLAEGEIQQLYNVNPVFLLLAELQSLYTIDVAKLREGELHNEYLVEDQKIEAQLNSLYSIRFAKQFESIYGVTVSRQLLAEAYYTIQKQFDAPYQIRTRVAKQLDGLFDITNISFVKADMNGIYSMARVTEQLDGTYSIGPVVRAQMDAPYILATVPVEKQFDSIYDIKITNPVSKQVKGIYAILTTQIINITGQPTVTLNGEVLDIESADVAIDEGSFVWRASIGILDIEDYVKFNINDEIVLNLYGEIFNLVVESKNLSRSGPAEVDMGLVAVSPAIKFDFPRATALDLSFSSPILAQDAAEQALDGEDIDWQIIDWLIPANRLAIKDGSPIQLVQNIVEAAGGVLESKPDGQLVARPLFPVSIPDFDTASLDQTYSDASDNLSVSESFSPTKRLNLFRILDITASKRDSIEFEFDEESVTEGDLKLFPSPFETNRVIKSSRGSEIGFQFIGVETEEREQQVEFKEGFATLSKPIETLISVVWEATDLGALTFTQGDTKIFSASVVSLYSLATIKYTTKFIKYRVTGVPETDVQFRAEVT